MKKYKIGFIPKYLPYQLENEYTVYYDMKVGNLKIQHIIYKSIKKEDCENKLKELNK